MKTGEQLVKHKNGCNSKTQSDKTSVCMNFFYCFCVLNPLLKLFPHIMVYPVYSEWIAFSVNVIKIK